MEQNKTGKYFKYAIGEIVLVVIGILIALQINNWNEQRKNNILEVQYLERFKTDLLKNKAELNRVINKTEQTYVSADSILSLNRKELDSLSLPNFAGYLMDGTGFTIFQTQEGTIQDIVGSGRLDVIKNNTLRLAMGSWEANLKSIREWEILNKKSANDYYDYLNKNFNMYKIDNREFPIDNATKLQLSNDKTFLNYIARRKRLSKVLNESYINELPKIDAILNEIENEL